MWKVTPDGRAERINHVGQASPADIIASPDERRVVVVVQSPHGWKPVFEWRSPRDTGVMVLLPSILAYGPRQVQMLVELCEGWFRLMRDREELLEPVPEPLCRFYKGLPPAVPASGDRHRMLAGFVKWLVESGRLKEVSHDDSHNPDHNPGHYEGSPSGHRAGAGA
jgi:hypothetical protein